MRRTKVEDLHVVHILRARVAAKHIHVVVKHQCCRDTGQFMLRPRVKSEDRRKNKRYITRTTHILTNAPE